MKDAGLAAVATLALLLAACGEDADEPAVDDAAEVVEEGSAEAMEVEDDAVTTDEVDGAEDGDDDTTSGGTDDVAGDDAAPVGAVDGEIVVEGVTYAVDVVRNCEPLDTGVSVGDLELQARTPDGGQIDVYVDDVLGDRISWAGDGGVYSTDAFGAEAATAVSVTIAGERVSGSGTLLDITGTDELIDLSFDLPMTETIACR